MLNDTPPPNFAVTSRNNLVEAMLRLKDQGQTWRQIGARYCITGAMAYRIARQDYTPVDPEIRLTLGLDAPTLPAEILEEYADLIELKLTKSKRAKLIDRSKVYLCRPPNQLEGRIYLKFMPQGKETTDA